MITITQNDRLICVFADIRADCALVRWSRYTSHGGDQSVGYVAIKSTEDKCNSLTCNSSAVVLVDLDILATKSIYDRFSICNTYSDILSDIKIVRPSSWMCVGFQCEKLYAIIVSSVAAKTNSPTKKKPSENWLRLQFFFCISDWL